MSFDFIIIFSICDYFLCSTSGRTGVRPISSSIDLWLVGVNVSAPLVGDICLYFLEFEGDSFPNSSCTDLKEWIALNFLDYGEFEEESDYSLGLSTYLLLDLNPSSAISDIRSLFSSGSFLAGLGLGCQNYYYYCKDDTV